MILTKKQTKIIVTGGAFLAFIIFGFADNLKGPLIPILLKEFKLSYAQGSNILLMLYLGFMLSILGSGFLAGKYGNRCVLLLSGLLISGAVAGMSFVYGKIFLYPLFLLTGFALGGIEVGANGVISDIYHEASGKYLNLLAVFHGVGSMIAPWLLGVLLENNLAWQVVYKRSFFPILLLPLTFLFIQFTSKKTGKGGRKNSKIKTVKTINANLILLAFLIFFYVAGEIGLSSWIVDYLYKVKKLSLSFSSLMLTVFWTFMMSGRLIASFIVDRIGYIKSMIISISLALLSFGLGMLPVKYLSIFLPLTGLFFAMIFPTAVAVAAKIFPENKAKSLSFLLFFAGIGGLIGPWVVGYTANWFGMAIGFPVLLIFILGTLVILAVLKFRLNT